MKWNPYFISLLNGICAKSKDTSTKVGAIIVNEDNIIVSTGWNGFCRGTKDDIEKYPERYERPAKYQYTEHAERNALYNAARIGAKVKDSTIYVSLPPCIECTRGIIQTGIKKVVVDKRNIKEDFLERWKKDFQISKILFEEAKVDYNEI